MSDDPAPAMVRRRSLWIEDFGLGLRHAPMPPNAMVMTAYFDESGTHEGSPATIMACCLSNAEGWARYETEMAKTLSEYGVKVLHAKRLRNSNSPYNSWPSERRRVFNAQMLEIFDRSVLSGFISVLRRDDYRRIYRLGGGAKVRHDTEYGLCFRHCLMQALLYMERVRDAWPLYVVLEDGHKHAADALRVYRDMRRRLPSRWNGVLGPISFESKITCHPLAAPDALAHSMFKVVERGHAMHMAGRGLPVGCRDQAGGAGEGAGGGGGLDRLRMHHPRRGRGEAGG